MTAFDRQGGFVGRFGRLQSERELLGSDHFGERNDDALNRVRLTFDDHGHLWAAFIHAPLVIEYATDGTEITRVRLKSSRIDHLVQQVLRDPATIDVASSDFDGIQLADVCRDIAFDAVHRNLLVLHGDNRVSVLDMEGAVIETISPNIPGGTIQTIAALPDGRYIGGYFLSPKLFSFGLR